MLAIPGLSPKDHPGITRGSPEHSSRKQGAKTEENIPISGLISLETEASEERR